MFFILFSGKGIKIVGSKKTKSLANQINTTSLDLIFALSFNY
jgi:hypothetical protein